TRPDSAAAWHSTASRRNTLSLLQVDIPNPPWLGVRRGMRIPSRDRTKAIPSSCPQSSTYLSPFFATTKSTAFDPCISAIILELAVRTAPAREASLTITTLFHQLILDPIAAKGINNSIFFDSRFHFMSHSRSTPELEDPEH